MDERTLVGHSKFLSLVLRHRPESIGIRLDEQGWVPIDSLLTQCAAHGKPISRAMLDEIVATNSKKRYAISEDGLRIRASQGHSVEVELGYKPSTPPDALFHGTPESNLKSIRAKGLDRMKRHHVHLSMDGETARAVGSRRGRAVVLRIQSGRMHRDGHSFYVSENGVWLTESVPPRYIE